MSTIDGIFLAACVLSLLLMLVFSKVIRAIVWESLRHPFTRSRIEVQDGRLRIWRVTSKGSAETEGEASSPLLAPDKTPEGKEIPRG